LGQVAEKEETAKQVSRDAIGNSKGRFPAADTGAIAGWCSRFAACRLDERDNVAPRAALCASRNPTHVIGRGVWAVELERLLSAEASYVPAPGALESEDRGFTHLPGQFWEDHHGWGIAREIVGSTSRIVTTRQVLPLIATSTRALSPSNSGTSSGWRKVYRRLRLPVRWTKNSVRPPSHGRLRQRSISTILVLTAMGRMRTNNERESIRSWPETETARTRPDRRPPLSQERP